MNESDDKGKLLFEEKPFFPIPNTKFFSLRRTYIDLIGIITLMGLLIFVFLLGSLYKDIYLLIIIISVFIFVILFLYYFLGQAIISGKPLKVYDNGIDMPKFFGYIFINSKSIKMIKILDLSSEFYSRYYKSKFAELKILTRDHKTYRTRIKSYVQLHKVKKIIRSNWDIEGLDLIFNE